MSSLNILVIEDDHDFAEGLAGVLETGRSPRRVERMWTDCIHYE